MTQRIRLNVNGEPVSHHYYTRYILPKTELWCFTVGLGEQAIMSQLGDAFLNAEDPELGRIMLAIGGGTIAEMPYRGDFNVWWGWHPDADFIPQYLERTVVQPDLALACSERLFAAFAESGLDVMLLPLATGTHFLPLGLRREGLGYVGGDNKSAEQKRLMLEPFLNRSDFDWHGCKASHEWFNDEKLNEWYNRKQILFGLSNRHASFWHVVPNRVFETFASGTPLLFPRHPSFKETFGFEQPYPVEREGDVERLVKKILGDYDSVLKQFQGLSLLTRAHHTYAQRLAGLFQRLKEMRR